MRKILFAVIALSVLLAVSAARAQVVGFGSGQALTGTTNTSAVDTNSQSVLVKKITLSVSSANSTIITGLTGNVWFTYTPNQPTNGVNVGTFTATNFTSTNMTFTGYYTNPPLYTVLQAQCGTNQILATELYGPNQN
jgi:hypothetical protein